jgi:hypothetical protein
MAGAPRRSSGGKRWTHVSFLAYILARLVW